MLVSPSLPPDCRGPRRWGDRRCGTSWRGADIFRGSIMGHQCVCPLEVFSNLNFAECVLSELLELLSSDSLRCSGGVVKEGALSDPAVVWFRGDMVLRCLWSLRGKGSSVLRGQRPRDIGKVLFSSSDT